MTGTGQAACPTSAAQAPAGGLFGRDPAAYAAHRPDYPAALWSLVDAWLAPALATDPAHCLEVGPGTGQATAHLLAHPHLQLTALEPDPALHGHLQQRFAAHCDSGRLQLQAQPLESALQSASDRHRFDAAIAATALHWVDAAVALPRLHQLLRPGGRLAVWWNVFGDSRQPDDFARASAPLFAALPGQPASPALNPALDVALQTQRLQAAGFCQIRPHLLHWDWHSDRAGMCGLAATFPLLARLPPAARQTFLDQLGSLIDRVFAGRVQRRFVSALYLAATPA